MKPFKVLSKKIITTTSMLFLANLSMAQTESFNYDDLFTYMILGLASLIAVLVLFVAIYMLHILKVIARDAAIKKAQEEGVEYVEEPGIWESISQKLTNAVPVESENSIELDHDYDGIKELDNHLPPWWKYLFYLTAIFSVIYMFVYHVSDSLPLQIEEYETDMAIAEAQKASMITESSGPTIDENNVEFTDDTANLSNGQKVFISQCSPCHKEKGEGGIGPNLTDEYWLHGGSIKDIFLTIKYGVPEKGMIAWEPLLSPIQMRDVSSFIKTLVGTNPPNAKGPQGEVYVEQEVTPEEGVTTEQ